MTRPANNLFIADWWSRQRSAEQFVAALVGIALGGVFVSHDSVISALNGLSKAQVISFQVSDHVDNILGESDRAAIILNASTLEHIITEMLTRAMPSLNSEETTRIFDVNGPLGTFSAKILMAQGLGILDRAMTRRMHIIRAMRNAAAHYVGPLSFDTPQIKDGVLQIASPRYRAALAEVNAFGLRAYLTHAQAMMSQVIAEVRPAYDDQETIQFIFDLVKLELETLRKTPEG